MIIRMIKIMTFNNAYTLLIQDYFDILIACLFLYEIIFPENKTLFRNAIRVRKSLDPDYVPYFVQPDLGPKRLQSRRYHEQSKML